MTLIPSGHFVRRTVRISLFVILAGQTAVANAQPVPYDPNCNPVQLTEDQKFGDEVCSSHAGCRFLVMAPIRAACKAVNFFRDIGTAGSVTNNEVIEIATEDLPRNTKLQQLVDKAKTAAQSALGNPKRDMVLTDDGRVAYYEGGHISGGTGNGALIYADGTMARGTFDPKYKLSGSGQLVTPDGKVRVGEFSNNQLSGLGMVLEKDGNRTVLIEGTFDGDTPVGEVIRNYADGSRVRELWEDGKMVARGERAAKGKVPPPINRPQTRLASADAKHGLYEVEGPNGSKRWELWCTNLLVDKGGWFPKGHYPQKPDRQTCDKKIKQAPTDESEFSTGDLIERTLGPSKTKPTAGPARLANPLIVQGPPWPCSAEITLLSQARTNHGRRGFLSAEDYWRQFAFSALRVLQDSSLSLVHRGYLNYAETVTGARPQEVTNSPLWEGYFRNEREMRALSASFIAGQNEYGDEDRAGKLLGACVASYLADNGRD